MNKEIKYNGLSTVPPDNTCQDGDSALLLNLFPEDGALKPVSVPKVVMELQANMRIIYIHKSSTFKNYIIHDTESKKLVWTSNGKDFTDLCALDAEKLHKVIVIGNTLIVLTDNGMLYFLWKGEHTKYLFLGNGIPELSLSFGLQGKMEQTDKFEITFDELTYHKDTVSQRVFFDKFSAENKKKITSQVLAKVNKFIADESTNKGRFLYPFLLRYAYRLYDGNLVMHSAPILMVCSTSCTPIVKSDFMHLDGGNSSADLRIIGMLHQLDYAVISESELALLKNWSDIVKSVDIFISKPIYTYDQNGECDKIYVKEELNEYDLGYSVCKHINQASDTAKYPVRYQMKSVGYLYQATYGASEIDGSPDLNVFGIPHKDISDVYKEINDCSTFYFLKSIKIGELTTTRTIINIKEDYLQSLVTREVMTDDYDSHNTLIPKNAFVYNSRVNLANVKKRLFNGFNTGSMLPFTDGYIEAKGNSLPTKFDRKIQLTAYICIKQGGKNIVVRGDTGVLGYDSPMFFIYYPNVNAYKAVLEYYDSNDNSREFYEVSLERHAFLNGSFYFGGFINMIKNSSSYFGDLRNMINDGFYFGEWGVKLVISSPVVSNENERTIDISNKIYTSEINNPFYYPLLGINTVGSGNIIGLCSAAKALSEGQFGQFPLYAFTTEGVWALEVSNTGTYKARQPITRDVCLSAMSLTQIDSAVLFATDRGIMLLQGSQATCISDILNGQNALPITMLPKIDKILEHADLSKESLNILPFMDFIRDCRMIYDYEHQRIIVYNNSKEYNCNYAYIFSLKSKQWGMMQSNIADNVNSYPDALAVLNDGSLVNFSDETDEVYKSIVVSRPIKLDAYDIHKSVDTIIQRGVFKKGHVKSILYASNDLYNWVPVWSSTDHYLRGFRGTPYKYIRIVLLANLSNDEGITGCSVQFTPRFTNQPR